MTYRCSCKAHKAGMDYINGIEALAFVHGSSGLPKGVEVMHYCAWCGSVLKDDETKLLPKVKLSTEDEL